MQIGIDSFAAAPFDNETGIMMSSADAIGQLLDRIEHADQAGLDIFGIGEHHRKDFLDSAPTIILAAAAARTKQIRLTSAVTVLSAADPVRVFQNFATPGSCFKRKGRDGGRPWLIHRVVSFIRFEFAGL